VRNQVDWNAQWKQHAPNFENGYARIDLNCYGMKGSLRLLPGAGFGDTSHPTTRLVLRLMANRVQDRTIIDIGCGCGILSLAALTGGASRAIGVDIDEEAVEHARLNSELNQLSNTFFAPRLPYTIEGDPLIVINMISSEQKAAWQASSGIHNLACPVIASGILACQRECYLEEVREQRGWHFIDELQEEGWLAFLFQQAYHEPLAIID